MKYTREDYMAGKCSHSEYYAQFVDKHLRQFVEWRIGRERIMQSTDPHFNDIPLRDWDILHVYIQRPSLAESVCVAKEAARQIKKQLEEIEK